MPKVELLNSSGFDVGYLVAPDNDGDGLSCLMRSMVTMIDDDHNGGNGNVPLPWEDICLYPSFINDNNDGSDICRCW